MKHMGRKSARPSFKGPFLRLTLLLGAMSLLFIVTISGRDLMSRQFPTKKAPLGVFHTVSRNIEQLQADAHTVVAAIEFLLRPENDPGTNQIDTIANGGLPQLTLASNGPAASMPKPTDLPVDIVSQRGSGLTNSVTPAS